MKTKTVLLIGAGNIAGAKPMAKPGGPVTTHIHAILSDERMQLVGIVDRDVDAAAALAKKWNVNNDVKVIQTVYAFSRTDDKSPDIVVIATTPKTHVDVINDVFRHLKPKIVLLEKPGGTDADEARYILAMCITNRCGLFLNYQRNYCPQITVEMICDAIGKPVYAQCDYVRGLKNDASHAIALFSKLFGYGAKNVLAYKRTINDLSGDPTVRAIYGLPNCEVALIGHDGRMFDVFEITIYGTHGKIVLADHGQQIIKTGITDEEVYGKYKKLQTGNENIGSADLSLSNTYNAILANCKGGDMVNYLDVWRTITLIKNIVEEN